MASTTCSICRQVTVRLAGDICRQCRKRGETDGTAEELKAVEEMDASQPRRILETALRQAAVLQLRFQPILDFAIHAEELGEASQIFRSITAGFQGLVPTWQKLTEAGRETFQNCPREEREAIFIEWFKKLPEAPAKSLLQSMTRILNERPQLPKSINGTGHD